MKDGGEDTDLFFPGRYSQDEYARYAPREYRVRRRLGLTFFGFAGASFAVSTIPKPNEYGYLCLAMMFFGAFALFKRFSLKRDMDVIVDGALSAERPAEPTAAPDPVS